MRKTLAFLMLLALAGALPAMGARVTVLPIEHDTIDLYQAYAGNSEGTNLAYRGFDGMGGDTTSAVAGILSIVPGSNWRNFVEAARHGVPYAIKNTVLIKDSPGSPPCTELFRDRMIYQHGTPNVRLWWPLMYEPPDTTWTLIILYGTYAPWDDDGAGPNPAGYVHQEIWRWRVTASQASMQNLLALFHELPFGTDEVPLISDEALYASLRQMLAAGRYADFADAVGSACISVSPINPDPTGAGTGIASTPETPACCKLLIDALYVRTHL